VRGKEWKRKELRDERGTKEKRGVMGGNVKSVTGGVRDRRREGSGWGSGKEGREECAREEMME